MENDFSKQIDYAYNLHVAGKFEEAKQEYEKLLEEEPGNIELRNLYASLNFSLGNYDIALEYFLKLYEELKLDDTAINITKVYLKKKEYRKAADFTSAIQNKTPKLIKAEAFSNFKLKNYDIAQSGYLRLIEDNNADLSDIFNLSLIYFKKQDYETAKKYALEVYEKNRGDLDVIMHLVSVYTMLKDTDKRLEYLTKAAEIKPDADIFFKIGLIYKNEEKTEKALEYFEKALDINPGHINAQFFIAETFENYDKYISLQKFERLYFQYPKDAMILFKLFTINLTLSNHNAALEAVKELIETDPEEPAYYIFAASISTNLAKYEDAIIYYEQAKKEGADEEYCDLKTAYIYSLTNNHDKVKEIMNNRQLKNKENSTEYAMLNFKYKNREKGRDAMHTHLITLKTEDEILHRTIGLFYKFNLDKQYGINENSFKSIKSDKTQKLFERVKYYLKKDLYDHNPDNKRIFIYNANGIGDIIMFSRYIDILNRHAKEVIISVPESIYGLIKTSFPGYKIIKENNEPFSEENYDYTASFFSLLVCLKEISLEDIPYSSGYLSVDDDLIKEKKEFDFLKTEKKKVGIFWQGNPGILPQRSVKLKELMPLFEIPDLQIYSFQISDIDNDSNELKKKLPLIDLAPHIKNYSDTAAFLKNTDILVTIDTSIANLAGALGVKTFLMLPYESEWRWFNDNETTPWYDSVRIFKQSLPYDWRDVVQRIKQELMKL